MLKLSDRPINKRQLAEELATLDLPGFAGIARMSRETDDQGRAILEDGSIKEVSPYIVVRCGILSDAQTTAVTAMVSNHVPSPPLRPHPTEMEILRDVLMSKGVITQANLDAVRTKLTG